MVPESEQIDRTSTAAAAVTLLLVIVGIALRWIGLGHESLWLDEAYTAWVADHNCRQILHIVAGDTAPPLHYLMQHGWTLLWGHSEVALRSLSALLSTLSIGLVYLLAKRLLKNPWAVAAAVGLFCLSGFQIDYSQEVRFYALMATLSLCGLWCMRCCLDRRREQKSCGWAMTGVVLATVAGLYTHNMMLLYLPMLDIAWLTMGEGPSLRQRFVDLLKVNALIVLIYLPWLFFLKAQVHSVHDNFWIGRPAAWQLMEDLSVLCGVDNYRTGAFLSGLLDKMGWHIHAFDIHIFWSGWPYRVLVCGALFGAIAWELYPIFISWRRWRYLTPGQSDVPIAPPRVLECAPNNTMPKNPGRREYPLPRREYNVLALSLYAIFPVLLMFVESRVSTPLLLERTLIASSGPLAILLAWPLSRSLSRRMRWVCGIILGLIVAGQLLSINGPWRPTRKQDWRGAAAYVQSLSLGPPERVRMIFLPAQGELLFDYYFQANGQIIPAIEKTGVPVDFFALDPPKPLNRVKDPTDLAGLRADLAPGKYRDIVFIRCSAWFYDPTERVLSTLREDKLLTLKEERDLGMGLIVQHYITTP